MEIITPLFVLFLGFTTAASSCVIHILSAVVAYSTGTKKQNKINPFLIVFGHFLSIMITGFLAVALGLAIEDYLPYLQIPAILFILGAGIYLMLIKKSDSCKNSCGCKKKISIDKLKEGNLLSSLLFGFSIGVLCVACILPVFGMVIAATAITDYPVILLLLSYAIGHSLPILIVAYFPYIAEKFVKKIIEKHIIVLRKISGIILIIISAYLFFRLFTY